MRQAKFVAALVLLVGLGAALYWYTTKSDRAEKVLDVELQHEQDPGTMFEAAPADSAAMADTLSVE